MDQILAFLLAYEEIIIQGISAAILTFGLILVIRHYWDAISFWWMDLWFAMPVVGRVRRLAGDPGIDPESQWFHSEKTLCEAYLSHTEQYEKDASFYDKCNSYLNLAGERGRKPFGLFLWALVFIMVTIEAMGFSYVLASYSIPGASENVVKIGAFFIAFLISIILVGFTHWAGYEIYKNMLIGKARALWNHDEEVDPLTGRKVPLAETGENVSIDTNDADASRRLYVRMLNRIGTSGEVRKRHIITPVTIILIIGVAFGATYVRGKALERELQDESTGASTHIAQVQSQSYFPPAMSQPQAAADLKTTDENTKLEREGGWGTFIVLAIVFVFLQIFGILLGFKFGYAGHESAIAHTIVTRFRSKEEFKRYYEMKRDAILRIGNRRLMEMQRQLATMVREVGTSAVAKDAAARTADRDIFTYRLWHKAHLRKLEADHAQNEAVAPAASNTVAPQVRMSTPSPAPVAIETEQERMARLERELDEEDKLSALVAKSDDEIKAELRAKRSGAGRLQ